ncbi:MAG TPA: DEAD/DEAH box helicase [Actinobacteria bacterium]|nr:DEAD/DEAH box helicase [Actinomycetota bacterium]
MTDTYTPTSEELATDVTFAELGVPEDLAAVLARRGISKPFPIQAAAIPDALAGRDVLGKAKTGSGKTLAFGLPIVARMRRAEPRRPRGLVLVPTRELARQVSDTLEPLLAGRDLGLVSVYGGASMGDQIRALDRGVEVVVATPGRLIDLLERRKVRFDDVEIVAIDEADQMADMGFMPQVRKIMDAMPRERQTMLFSATLDHQVTELVDRYLTDPVRHEVDTTTETVTTMSHRFLKVHHLDKVRVAARIARAARRTLVFTRTKHGADRLAKDLRAEGISVAPIHGDLPQHQRERALERFRAGEITTLVATNVAARGLHIDHVDVVVHYDPPDDPKTYLHRSGRTARAGEEGLVVTLVEWDQVNEVIAIQRRAGLNVPIVKMLSNDPRLDDLAGWEPPEELAPFRGKTRRVRSLGRRRRRR